MARCYTLEIVKQHRKPAAWLALLAVLFAQLAMAAYACPLIEEALQGPPSNVEATAPCADMDSAGSEAMSALCLEHCKAGGQLVDNHPPVTAFAPAPVVFFVAPTAVADSTVPARATAPLDARATAPPVFASSSRLRI